MPVSPSDQNEFNEQISGFFRREPSQAEAKKKLAAHCNEMMTQIPAMLPVLTDYPVYAAVAFHGRFDWVDKNCIKSLIAKKAKPADALQIIREKKALRIAASAKAGWDLLLKDAPGPLWMAIQLNLAGWTNPKLGGAPAANEDEDFGDEHDADDHDEQEEKEDDENEQ